MPLDVGNMYFVDVITVHRFEDLLATFSKCGPSAQMTMPARHALKFCAKRRAALAHMSFCCSLLVFLGNSWYDRTLAIVTDPVPDPDTVTSFWGPQWNYPSMALTRLIRVRGVFLKIWIYRDKLNSATNKPLFRV